MHKRLLSTSRFAIERREYVQPGQEPIIRYVVVHVGAVVVLPLLADGRIVMIRHLRRAVGEELLELPAGTREPDEPPIDTARRELEEETGYRAGSIAPLAEFYTSPGILTEKMYAYVASDLSRVRQALEHGEQIVVDLVDADEARRRLIEGEIHDGKTMAVLGCYFLGLGR